LIVFSRPKAEKFLQRWAMGFWLYPTTQQTKRRILPHPNRPGGAFCRPPAPQAANQFSAVKMSATNAFPSRAQGGKRDLKVTGHPQINQRYVD
jgi:hypothetical protein